MQYEGKSNLIKVARRKNKERKREEGLYLNFEQNDISVPTKERNRKEYGNENQIKKAVFVSMPKVSFSFFFFRIKRAPYTSIYYLLIK